MAGDKTEKATPKRRADARKEGRVPKSTDVNSAAVLFGSFGALILLAPTLLSEFQSVLREGLARTADPEHLGGLLSFAALSIVKIAGPIVAAGAASGVAANIAQVRFKFTPIALKPSLQKLDPIKGVKNLFGKNGLVETGKALLKVVVIGLLTFVSVWPKLPELALLVGLPPADLLHALATEIRDLALRAGLAIALIAAADYAWQRYRHEHSLKMTKSELKNEMKQTDTPPEVKRAIRRRQAQQARKRMLADVPTADVVVVNPTHFAVALRYDGSTTAPQVVAKGVDLVAAAIRKIAQENRVPVVHNAPLARSLYREVEVGQMIPEAFFAAVAEVLAFVFRTAGAARLKSRRKKPIRNKNAVRSSSPARPRPALEG